MTKHLYPCDKCDEIFDMGEDSTERLCPKCRKAKEEKEKKKLNKIPETEGDSVKV
jgi:predicted  nucleic acid-binding Zn-ribbon protein